MQTQMGYTTFYSLSVNIHFLYDKEGHSMKTANFRSYQIT
jgi:hypothetical protein